MASVMDVVWWCYILCVSYVSSFNLETRIPIVKVGKEDSYFGFSVAGHRTVAESGAGTNWILVGAPLDQNLQPNSSRSGALWKCPITPNPSDCTQVITDGRRDNHRYNMNNVDSNELWPPSVEETKTEQWLGVSVRSQEGSDGKVIVCAHRYIRKFGDSQYAQGLCYLFENNFELDRVWEPCKGRHTSVDHEEFGYCQAGISSNILEDGALLIGAPGSYSWIGAMFKTDTGDLFARHENAYSPVINSPIELYSYTGMAVAGGKFFSSDYTYVTGAPRSKHTGQVIFLKQMKWSDNIMNILMIIDGEQFGSNFGYELATADVNGDGLPDLLVGAPFYFTSDTGGAVYLYLNKERSFKNEWDVKLTGSSESQYGISIANAGDLNKDGCDDIAIGSPREGNGVVYIYLGNRKSGLERIPKQVIKAEDLPVKMTSFGYSLSRGFDLDDNKYPDLLAGAYDSSMIVLLRARPIIDIETFVQPKSALKNIDPTKKGCKHDPQANYTCFHFEACCKISTLVESDFGGTYMLSYALEAETFPGGRIFSRVFFGQNPSAKRSNIITGTQKVTKDQRYCKEHIVYLKENTRDLLSPISMQLNYSLVQADPVYNPSGRLVSLEDYPVLNSTSSKSFNATFLNDCKNDEECISNLVLKVELDLPMSDENQTSYMVTLGQQEEVKLLIWPDNLGESAYDAHLYVKHHPALHYIAANISDKRIICNFHNQTLVVCSLANPFKKQNLDTNMITLRFDPRALKDDQLNIDFEVFMNSTSKEMVANKKPVRVDAVVVKNAELFIKGVAWPDQVFYGGAIKGESAMKYLNDIGTRIVHVYEVTNQGPWHVQSVTVEIEWPLQVASDSEEGKWLLYLDALPTVEAHEGGECYVNSRYINQLNLIPRPGYKDAPMNLVQLESHEAKWSLNDSKNKSRSFQENRLRRRRRDVDDMRAEALVDKDGKRKQIVNLNCQDQTAKCIKFQCLIHRLARKQSATLTISARLWNSTLVEDYPRVGSVMLASSAKLLLPVHFNIHQNNITDDSTTVETTAYPDLIATADYTIPTWVIAVAVLAGLLVLILLILALWKFGFFKRSRPDPTLSGNLEKNTEEVSPFLVRNRKN